MWTLPADGSVPEGVAWWWRHVLCQGGRVVDRFTSDRFYFGSEDDPGPAWDGNAGAIARTAGVDAGLLAPHLVAAPRSGRAWPDDEFGLGDPWVCVDFWRRLGIRYPDPAGVATVTLEFDVALGSLLPREGMDF